MSNPKSYFLRVYEKTNFLLDTKSKHGFSRGGVGNKWGIWMMAVGFLFCFSLSSEAGMVYGRVSGGNFIPGETLAIYDSQNRKVKDVPTDSQGGYSVLLPEGSFRVVYVVSGDAWEAWIQSTPSAVRQDINLKRR